MFRDRQGRLRPQRAWPPGYVDPPGLLALVAKYLDKWEREGKPPTPFRKRLALGIARHVYWHPHLNEKTHAQLKAYKSAKTMRMNGHYERLKRANYTARATRQSVIRAQIRKQQQQELARTGTVRRQFFTSID